MLFRKINMTHVFIEVTKLKTRCENYKNTITNFHITICDSFKKSTFKSQSTPFISTFEELAKCTLTTKKIYYSMFFWP